MRHNRLIKKTQLIWLIAIATLNFANCSIPLDSLEIPTDIDFTADYKPFVIDVDASVTEYKILQLADTQLNLSNSIYLDDKFSFLTKVINTADPDLIVLTGDNTAGISGIKILEKLIPFLDSFKIPYAPVFGNHDAEGGSGETLAPYYIEGEYCLFEVGPTTIHGVGNYQININQNNETQYNLYMMDSNRYRHYTAEEKAASVWGGKDYDVIYPDQIAWYRFNVNKTTELNNKVIDSLAFFHIAIPEFRAYKQAAAEDIIIEQKNAGEDVNNGYINTGLFSEMKTLNSTKGVFVGHDHVNNYVFNYQGIVLGYGLKSGQTSYFDKELQGGTLITLKNSFQEFEVEHLFIAE